MRVAATIFLALLLTCYCGTQENSRKPASAAEPRQASTAGPKLTKEQQVRVTRLLQQAEAGAATLDPASRIVAYADLARTLEPRDKAKSIDLLDSALDACRDLQPESTNNRQSDELRENLQRRVMEAMTRIAPERLDARVFDLSPDMRKTAADLLVSYYVNHKLFDRAYELIMRVAGEGEMPYGSAISLMKGMKDRPDQVRSLFVSSLSSYENHAEQQGFSMMADFADMIVTFHDQIPNQIVMQAIDDVLQQAKQKDESGSKMNLSMSSSKGAVQFRSTYEFRLFQLGPIVRQIDPARAELLLKDQQQVATQLGKYPDGTNSLHDGDSPNSGMSMGITMGDGPRRPGPMGGLPSPLEQEHVAQILSDASKHPQDALANAALLSPHMAIAVYEEIARQNVKTDTAVARTALSKAQDLIEKNPDDRDMFKFEKIADTYRQVGDTDNAKKAIDKGMDAAAKLYKKDIDPDDPNTAPKAYWPSTNTYRSLLRQAQKIDARWAQSLLDEIPDDSIRVFNEIAMADAVLGTPPTMYSVMSMPKKGDGGFTMMIGNGN